MEQEPNVEAGPEPESKEIADILRGYGEEHGFDEETCQEVEALSFVEAYEAAYGYLTQAGLDADEILAVLIEQPE